MKSFISREVFDGMRPKQELEATHQRCFGITGKQLQVDGTVQATLSFPSSGSFLYAGKFFISGQLFQPLQCVLGWDFLTSNALNLLYKGQGAYVLAGRHRETPLTPKTQDVSPLPSADKSLGCEVRATDTASCLLAQSSSRGPVNVTLSTSLCIPSRTEVLVNCQLPKSFKDQLGMVTPIQDDSPLSASIFPAYSVSQAEGRHIPQDQHKTAFVTPSGLREFQRMPFGVSNGCATFQRAIEIVLLGLTYETCLCYFDDVIVPSSNLQQQCERLALVLERFRKHNLRVKATKCTFGANKVNYLGHVVSAEGVHTDPDKIKAVSLLAEPQNVEQVRSFLGLAGYYRKFIPKFAMLAAPLVSLTKKGTKFHWSKEHSESFLVLKDLLCQAPVLAYPRFDHPFFLQTDASDLGLGAVLTQIDADGNECVISYASRPLTDREKGYSATEKEA